MRKNVIYLMGCAAVMILAVLCRQKQGQHGAEDSSGVRPDIC